MTRQPCSSETPDLVFLVVVVTFPWNVSKLIISLNSVFRKTRTPIEGDGDDGEAKLRKLA